MDPSLDRVESEKKRMIHQQVLRIREEDRRIGDRIGEGDRDLAAISAIRAPMEAFLFSRPMLPSSPLGNKAAVGATSFA